MKVLTIAVSLVIICKTASSLECTKDKLKPVSKIKPVLFNDFVEPFHQNNLYYVKYSYTTQNENSTEHCNFSQNREFVVFLGRDNGLLVVNSTACKVYTFWRNHKNHLEGQLGMLEFEDNLHGFRYNIGFFVDNVTSQRVYYVHENYSTNLYEKFRMISFSNDMSKSEILQMVCELCFKSGCTAFQNQVHQFEEQVERNLSRRRLVRTVCISWVIFVFIVCFGLLSKKLIKRGLILLNK